MRSSVGISLALLALVACAVAPALCQPFNFTGRFHEPLSEPAQRQKVKYEGLTFDFKNKGVAEVTTPNSALIPNTVSQNPFLATLPDGGNAQVLVKLGPCAGTGPHTHPRGSEIATLLYGNITFGFVEENTANNTLLARDLLPLETIAIPMGLIHYAYNPNCKPAAFLANFGTDDPGFQSTWNSFIQIPIPVLHAATGISQERLEQMKQNLLTMPPATGGLNCLARCNLSYHEANQFIGLPRQ